MPSSTPTLREPLSRSPPRPRAAGGPASVTRGPSGTTTDRRPAFRQPTAAGVAIPEPHRNPRPCHVTKHAPDRPPRGPSRPGCWPRTLGGRFQVITPGPADVASLGLSTPCGLQRRCAPGIANGLRFSVGARAPHRRRGADRRGTGGRTAGDGRSARPMTIRAGHDEARRGRFTFLGGHRGAVRGIGTWAVRFVATRSRYPVRGGGGGRGG